MKLQIKSILGSVLFEYECEQNTRLKTLLEAIKSGANLRSADLRSADLHSADLWGANLWGADLDNRYIQVSCIGSAKRITTYCFEEDKIWCGCFTGTLGEFEAKVQETHKDNEVYLKEYLGFINYIKLIK